MKLQYNYASLGPCNLIYKTKSRSKQESKRIADKAWKTLKRILKTLSHNSDTQDAELNCVSFLE